MEEALDLSFDRLLMMMMMMMMMMNLTNNYTTLKMKAGIVYSIMWFAGWIIRYSNPDRHKTVLLPLNNQNVLEAHPVL